MRLYNPTKRIVHLRDEVKKQIVVLKPEDVITVEPHLRVAFTKYVNAFGLQWLLDESDLAPSARGRSSEFTGTHKNFIKEDKGLDLKKAQEQSDVAEIAEIWREQVVNHVPHEAVVSKDNADFLFLKEDTTESLVEETPETLAPVLEVDTTVPEDGPDYLRNTTASEELEGFGEITDDFLPEDEGSEPLPDSAPVTISQLRLSTKAQLWEMGDKLGLDTAGTKNEIIDRICRYHWKAHQLRLQMMQNH